MNTTPFDTQAGPPHFGSPAEYNPPSTSGAWQPSSTVQDEDEDEPFTAAHLAAASEAAVPAVPAAGAFAGAAAGSSSSSWQPPQQQPQQQRSALAFTGVQWLDGWVGGG